MPMHVGGLQLFEKPEGAGRDYVARPVPADARRRRDRAAVPQAAAPVGRRPPASGCGSTTTSSTSTTTCGTARCPSRAGSASCSSSCSRLHGTRLARERPLWEAHVIEGLRDGRVAMYTKLHHALVDGVSAMRLLQSVLTTDPDQRGMPPPWAARRGRAPRPSGPRHQADHDAGRTCRSAAFRTALGRRRRRRRAARRAGHDAQPRGPQRDLGAVALRTRARSSTRRSPGRAGSPPRTGRSSGCARSARPAAPRINDVVLAMCSGAMRTYLAELDALPDSPAGRDGAGRAQRQAVAERLGEGGNAVGAVMVQARHPPGRPRRPAGRRSTRSMTDGKEALGAMTPMQILAMSALGHGAGDAHPAAAAAAASPGRRST